MGAPSGSVIERYDGVICDLDGVVYRGGDAVPGAPAALQDMVIRGVRVVYATNNASRVPAEVARQVAALGAPAAAMDVVSSAQAGAARLQAQLPAGAKVLALGGDGVVEALDQVGLAPVRPADLDGTGAADVAAVLQGYGRQLRVSDFETAARLLTRDLAWVATNDDATLPLPWGESPGNGAYVDLLVTATRRRPVVVGKPHPPLYRLALDHLGTSPSRTLAVGDRLATDIVGAATAGIHSAWVLTGVDRPSDLVGSGASPTYVVASLAELLQPYAVAERDADGWRCGGAFVRAGEDGLQIAQGRGTPAEAVRAGLAAIEEGAQDGRPTDRLREEALALDRLLDLAQASSR
ncbi:HAD-IIA family hydrolase [Terrabacter sp. MAHUQ-38]|uniref:HAD-IIA family hydrolase n=1 Tax=unclassified Terrabacter TaxID=2630222 RepID=UPI00165D54E9|nr:HAD-IIA family hydrolase [Terrabacter sp. MAHUQ-38]MBC9823193.1 HAD-IIA family hydrolase [Terrabacter sp. MAHUQ-38]